MEPLDLLLVLCAVAVLALAVTFSVLCTRVLRAAEELRDAAAAFERAAVPAVEELTDASRRAAHEVDRMDDLLDVAGSIGGRVDAATGATYRVLTSPVIKGAAFASGTRRAAQRLRVGRRGHDTAGRQR